MGFFVSRLGTFPDQTDPDLELRVRASLSKLGRQSLKLVQVRVSQAVVFLNGRVSSFYERQLAINACQRVTGIHHVTDSIKVSL